MFEFTHELREYFGRLAADTDAALDHRDELVLTVERGNRPRRGRGLALLVTVVLLVGAGWALFSLSDSGSEEGEIVSASNDGGPSQEVTDGVGEPTEVTPSPEQLAEARQRIDEQEARGWVHYAGRSAVEGVEAPDGWVKMKESTPDRVHQRFPIYDMPSGSVIGYHYGAVGFVPLEMADSFDGAAARVGLYGCDVLLDEECREG